MSFLKKTVLSFDFSACLLNLLILTVYHSEAILFKELCVDRVPCLFKLRKGY